MEDAAQGSKRETGQQLRELQVEHGAALRQLASLQEAAARTQEKLKVGVHSSRARFLLPPKCSRFVRLPYRALRQLSSLQEGAVLSQEKLKMRPQQRSMHPLQSCAHVTLAMHSLIPGVQARGS